MTRVAWVTGASSGIGREVALELAGNGWTVAGSARTQSDLERLVRDTQGLPGRAVAYPVDVTDAAEVEAARRGKEVAEKPKDTNPKVRFYTPAEVRCDYHLIII